MPLLIPQPVFPPLTSTYVNDGKELIGVVDIDAEVLLHGTVDTNVDAERVHSLVLDTIFEYEDSRIVTR